MRRCAASSPSTSVSGNVTLSDAQFRSSIAFRAANLSVARDLTVPAMKRLFVVSNTDGTNTLTVRRGATSIAIASGKLALLLTDDTTDGLFAAAADSGARAVTSVFGQPPSDGALAHENAARHLASPLQGVPPGAADAGNAQPFGLADQTVRPIEDCEVGQLVVPFTNG